MSRRQEVLKIIPMLYILMALIAVFSLDLGINLADLAREYGHGHSYHTIHGWALIAVGQAVAIIVLGLAIHSRIKRLSAPAGEGPNDH